MRLCYAAMRFGRDWKVVSGQRQIGHYATQASAVSAAASLALEAIASGHQVELLVQQESGELVRAEPEACLDQDEVSPAERQLA